MDLAKLLDNVGALPGVEGTCVFDLGGTLRINRLPGFLGGEPLLRAHSSVEDLYRTMNLRGVPSDDFMLHFEDHWLLLRRAGDIILVVLAKRTARLSSVRMLTNVLVRNLTPDVLASVARLPSPVAGPENETAPDPNDSAPLSPRRPVRMYRGQPY